MTTDPTPAVEVWARMLCAADVHVYGTDHPTWQQLAGEPGSRIRDDYRKAAAWLLPRLTVSAVAPATDRAALRDRIADVLANADGWKWAPGFKAHSPTWHGYQTRADAVLAVLPASVDRATVLEEAADFVRGLLLTRTSITTAGLEAELRRMAAESVPADAGRAGGKTQAVRCSVAVLDRPHGPHPWEPQPGMQPVRCPGACNCAHPEEEHSVYGCADGCACEYLPSRKPAGGAQQPKETRP
jgi:hypothetical protein